MKRLFSAVAIVLGAGLAGVIFLWPAQHTGPEPMRYGREMCSHCRMHISGPGFGGEFRDGNGVLTKYDDIGCMLQAMIGLHREVPEAWVEDHGGGGFVPLLTAHLVRGEPSDTPMGSGLVAFRDTAAAQAYAQAHGAELVRLEDVVRNPARLAQAVARQKPMMSAD